MVDEKWHSTARGQFMERYDSTSGGQEHQLRDRMVPNRVGDLRNGWIVQMNWDFFLRPTTKKS